MNSCHKRINMSTAASPIEIFLGRLCPLILDFGDDTNLVEEFSKSFSTTKVKEVINSFLLESTTSAIFIEYEKIQDSEENRVTMEPFTFSLEPNPVSDRLVVSLSLVKCNALPIDSTLSIASQVRVIKLHNNLAAVTPTISSTASSTEEKSGGNRNSDNDTSNLSNQDTEGSAHGLQALYDFVHYTFGPLIRSLDAGGKIDPDSNNNNTSSNIHPNSSSQTLPAVAKSLKEFEYALKNCMQHTEIPRVNFQLEPEIQEAVNTCDKVTKIDGSSGGSSRPSLDQLGFGSMEDTDILSRLASSVKRWTIDIQKVTSLDRDINAGAAVQEINFWRNMEAALEHVDTQVESTGVLLTIEILNREKQFYVTMPFRQDTGLSKAKKKVEGYMLLLRDFPINSILTSSDIKQMTDAIMSIFNHLRRMKSAQYPVERAFRLLEAISRDLSYQIIDVLASLRLMKLSYDTFVELTDGCDHLFRTWDEQSSHFRELARDIAKKRGENRGALPTGLTLDHRSLQSRIEDVREFRKNHEKLRDVISRVLPSEVASEVGDNVNNGSGATNDVLAAYQHMLGIDVLDVSKEGKMKWESAKRNYEIRIDRVESQITEKLTDLLATAKTGDEKFRVFSKFNALFFRHRIRGAIQQHQAGLISTVKEDIHQLQNMFKRSYTRSEAEKMSSVRDLPPMSGKIIWAKQIERQLNMYIERIEAVLGKDWERHSEGRSLKAICDSFRRKLATQPIFDEWMAKINIARTNNPDFEVNGNIFSIVEKKNYDNTNILSLQVSFDPDIIMLFKEVRNLDWLNQTSSDRNHFRVPYTLKIISDEAKEKYPYAMALNETLRTYQSTLSKVDDSLKPLVAGLHRSVQSKIHGAFKNHIRWDSEGLEYYVKELSEQIYLLQDRVNDLLDKSNTINEQITLLLKCQYNKVEFSNILLSIQKVVDELNLAEYTNLDEWTLILERRIEKELIKRLNYAIVSWTSALKIRWNETNKSSNKNNSDTSDNNDNNDNSSNSSSSNEINEIMKLKMVSDHTNILLESLPDTIHELGLRNQVLMLRPPLEAARVIWHNLLNSLILTVTTLERIQSSRYDDAFASSSPSKLSSRGNNNFKQYNEDEEEEIRNKSYSHIITNVSPIVLKHAYSFIEMNVIEVEKYVQNWFQYQALWDMAPSVVFETLGDSVSKWQQLLRDIKNARSTFDNHDTAKEFGFIVVDYGAVQQKVIDKYDAWHKDMLIKFGSMVNTSMRNFHTTIQKARTELEIRTLDADIIELIEYVTSVQEYRQYLDEWTILLETFKTSQRLLQSQRYRFPSDWMWLANIEGEWDAFQQILDRKWKDMEKRIPLLQKRILNEDRLLEISINVTEKEWKLERNEKLMKSTNPVEALRTLDQFDQRLKILNENYNRIIKEQQQQQQ